METQIRLFPQESSEIVVAVADSLFFGECESAVQVEEVSCDAQQIKRYVGEFWTAKQRAAASIHEVSYRACFKPQLPSFFITRFTKEGDTVYDPFSGRGTTAIEAGLSGRRVIANDINPLSELLAKPRFFVPKIKEVEERLRKIPFSKDSQSNIDLSMFYQPDTEAELVSLRNYLLTRQQTNTEDHIDSWIRMVATNRLTGHSPGFFSVYTLPPNQAVSPESQKKINKRLNQIPEYRDTRKIILKKTKSLISDLSVIQQKNLLSAGQSGLFLHNDSRETPEIQSNSVQLTVTSPPFLDIVQYSKDNWLRCWFNSIDDKKIAKNITMSRSIDEWCTVMGAVFKELHRITRPEGWVAFEVGEVRNGSMKLDEFVVPLGTNAGFKCRGIIINSQKFTKTSNIWGVKNQSRGTNTNRIVLFQKE